MSGIVTITFKEPIELTTNLHVTVAKTFEGISNLLVSVCNDRAAHFLCDICCSNYSKLFFSSQRSSINHRVKQTGFTFV